MDCREVVRILEMIENLWNSLFGAGGNKVRHAPIIEETHTNLDSAQEEPFYQLSLDEEVEVLARELGGLASGMNLEIDLHRILEICPRKRKKADAYLGLKKKLRDEFGIELTITSRTSKKEDTVDGKE